MSGPRSAAAVNKMIGRIVSAKAFLWTRCQFTLVLSQAYTETVRIKLPDGFQVDELPEPLKIEEPFGSYSASHELQVGFLIFTRSLTIRRSMLPVERYSSIRSFYQKILAIEQSPAVLI